MPVAHPLVSVIVPVYGVQDYLQQCIDSILNQTYPHLEIILIDDGSQDNCGDICDRNAINDSRIIVVHKENSGLSGARNTGLDIAAGKYISFVDADDTVHPQFIESLVNLCEEHDCDIAQCNFWSITENSVRLPLNPQSSVKFYDNRQALRALCSGQNSTNYSIAWNKVYKRILFEKIRYPLGRIHEDEFTTYLLFWMAEKIAVTNQYLYYYLRSETSITGRPFSIERLDVLDAYKERLVFLNKNNLEKEYNDTLYSYIFLIKKNHDLLKRYVKNSHEVCAELLAEKEQLEKYYSLPGSKESAEVFQIDFNFSFPEDSRIILYGAGKRGCICYQWMQKNCRGNIVGWVDNMWFGKIDMEYPIKPIDFILNIQFDYIIITIGNTEIQEEIKSNLVYWGVPRGKILVI